MHDPSMAEESASLLGEEGLRAGGQAMKLGWAHASLTLYFLGVGNITNFLFFSVFNGLLGNLSFSRNSITFYKIAENPMIDIPTNY